MMCLTQIINKLLKPACLAAAALCMGNLNHRVYAQTANLEQTRQYIKSHWTEVVKTHVNDSSTLIGLPKPYTVPGIGGSFQEMYYWDTYFTNVGLIRDGQVAQARNNVDNVVYLVQRFGFMPNGNRTFYLIRSQAPYLSMMIRDVYEHTRDRAWLASVLPVLEKEYQFWMRERITPSGLNHYSGEMADRKRKLSMFASADRRLNISKTITPLTDSVKVVYGGHFIAECESGWDFNPRFNSRCADYLPVDLNCNLFMYEKNFSYFYQELNRQPLINWEQKAAARQTLIRKYLLNPTNGLFYDHDLSSGKLSNIFSAAAFNVLWSGAATKDDARRLVANLKRLEANHGIFACEKGYRQAAYQWDAPNGWANLQYVAIAGLSRYGYIKDALRIAAKYAQVIAANFSKTGKLWEKYNLEDGTLNATNEYQLPQLMGWTAGVFDYCDDLLKENAGKE